MQNHYSHFMNCVGRAIHVYGLSTDRWNSHCYELKTGITQSRMLNAYCALSAMRHFDNFKQAGESLITYACHNNIVHIFFYVLLTVHLSIILVTDQLKAQILVL